MSGQLVRAAGLVVYRKDQPLGTIKYLIMKASYGSYHWSPPKGHVDPGEDDLTTALRETKEEAGLGRGEHYRLCEDFRRELTYQVKGKPKVVVYWLAELNPSLTESIVTLSREHTEYRWLPLGEAKEVSGYKDMADLLDECELFISSQ